MLYEIMLFLANHIISHENTLLQRISFCCLSESRIFLTLRCNSTQPSPKLGFLFMLYTDVDTFWIVYVYNKWQTYLNELESTTVYASVWKICYNSFCHCSQSRHFHSSMFISKTKIITSGSDVSIPLYISCRLCYRSSEYSKRSACLQRSSKKSF